jgi:ribose transport system ATP-binding protein
LLLETKGIRKQFNGVYALEGVDFSVEAGEVHGLVGENGAGKSTLIKILTGVYRLEEGEIFWNGEKLAIHTPADSRAAGICVIHQDHVLVPTMNGIENIFLGLEYPRRHGRVDWKEMRRIAQEKMQELHMEIDLTVPAGELTPPERTCIEIIRAMMQKCRLLILDEPTASLTDREAEILFGIIARLKEEGTAILYVSHRMDEIFRLTDRITVMKNGQISGVLKTAETDREGVITLMTDEWTSANDSVRRGNASDPGSEQAAREGAGEEEIFGKTALKVTGLQSSDGRVRSADLEARHGEILGIFGLGGSGRTELLESIYGYRPTCAGEVYLDGRQLEKRSPERSLKQGITLICEDRRGKAMVGSRSICDNILISVMDDYTRVGVLDQKRQADTVQEMIRTLNIRQTGIHQPVQELSGGNQQKVVFARAMMTKPTVWLCDEPTQAVDIRTRSEIHRLLRQKADEGNAVVLVTSDLKEMLEVADRIQIMAAGRTKEVLENRDLQARDVLARCYESA